MPAHLVETSEEDSFQAVANFIADLLDEGQVRGTSAKEEASCPKMLRTFVQIWKNHPGHSVKVGGVRG